MTEKEWLGEDNQLGIDIWKNKYCYEGEDFEAWLDRICGGDSEVIDLVKNKKFLFGGRILSNRGLQNKGKKVSLSNCYVIEPPEDEIESIFECATKLARTLQLRRRMRRRHFQIKSERRTHQQCGQTYKRFRFFYGTVLPCD